MACGQAGLHISLISKSRKGRRVAGVEEVIRKCVFHISRNPEPFRLFTTAFLRLFKTLDRNQKKGSARKALPFFLKDDEM